MNDYYDNNDRVLVKFSAFVFSWQKIKLYK